MEGRDGLSISGVTVVGSDAPSDYHVAPRTENPSQAAGPTPAPTTQLGVSLPAVGGAPTVKKKRGRPRKYGPDGTVTMALSPKPISSSAPSPVIDFSAAKRGKVRPVGSASKQHKMEVDNLGDWVSCSVGANFTPHMITVNAGEDVTMKVISFSQQGPRAICILSANGVISSVTLRQPDSSGGTLTYEGRFEILSLTGSFMPAETGGIRNRSGGMSVSLASPDGRVVGGGVAGLLVAASPVQVWHLFFLLSLPSCCLGSRGAGILRIVVGSFLAGNQHEQKPKKQKTESITTSTQPTAAIPISSASTEIEDTFGVQHTSTTPKPNLSSSSSFRVDNWSPLPPDSRNKPTDINLTLPG
ncbi:hypothetical protein TEA_022787 [Camellia sinensis var. sinensis]|uniref:AT-hook motif nuclear-localized protein n=1 Tax=Camellia sinensis var. sinensis TaxID=542762 RepID=A0A4S4EDR5_CAMSN|nr:hypothetical protein TEA_022787 [Camellia sinensis var. sinensis]